MPTDGSRILSPEDLLETIFPDVEEPPVRKDYSILFEDDDLVAVDKPGNLPCHPGGKFFEHTLWSLLGRRSEKKTFYFIHRLDRETSGIVLIAKSAGVARILQGDLMAGLMAKRYLVMVSGAFPKEDLIAAGYLMHDRQSSVRKKRLFIRSAKNSDWEKKGAKWCETSFRRLLHNDGTSLLEAIPATGRLHQIRATLLCLGFPIVGDKLYGPDEKIFLRFINGRLTAEDRAALRLSGQALHSSSLKIRHPASKKPLAFKARVPLEWNPILRSMEKSSRPRAL
jgi:23S rRNA pseudouridine955/2504/2580 synthase/23S rRNA pseudouridine1911/1915/1917 synthase